MSQMASGGWDRGLVSLYQFLHSLPLSPSKPAPGCPLTLPPSGASPRPASVRWAPLKGCWPQVQVGSGPPQLGLHGADWELQHLLRLQHGQSALCSGESGLLRFFTGADQGCLSHDCLSHSASRPPGPPWGRPSQDGLLAKAESQSLRANQVLFSVHLRGTLGLLPQLGFCKHAALGCRHLYKVQISLPLDKYPDVDKYPDTGLLNLMAVLFCSFLKKLHILQHFTPFCVPTNSA